MSVLDVLDMFNLIDRVQGLVAGIYYGDAGREFRIEHTEKRNGQGYEDMLRQRGVAVYGRRITSKYVIFRVKRRQARWAEHILLRAGAPVVSRPVDGSNAGASERHGGQLPPAWRDRRKR